MVGIWNLLLGQKAYFHGLCWLVLGSFPWFLPRNLGKARASKPSAWYLRYTSGFNGEKICQKRPNFDYSCSVRNMYPTQLLVDIRQWSTPIFQMCNFVTKKPSESFGSSRSHDPMLNASIIGGKTSPNISHLSLRFTYSTYSVIFFWLPLLQFNHIILPIIFIINHPCHDFHPWKTHSGGFRVAWPKS